MIMSDVSLKPYTDKLYHNEDLKSLTRYRFDKVSQRAKLKQSISRLVNILFPELEKLVSTLHGKAVYALLSEFPSAQHIASANLKHLTLLPIESPISHMSPEKISKKPNRNVLINRIIGDSVSNPNPANIAFIH